MAKSGNENKLETKVLLVEDEVPIVTMLRYNLEREGFKIYSTGDGDEAVSLVKAHHPDVIVLDWMLPGMSGIDICLTLRKQEETKAVPIIMLSARGEESDRIRGLDAGADDYMVKPFSPAELISRIKAVLRRIRPALAQKFLNFADLKMDLATHHVFRGDKEVHLSPTEFGLLRYLMEHPGRVFSREQLLDAVWGSDIYVELRTVDVHIRRLRKGLDPEGTMPELVRTVRSAGYALEEIPGTAVEGK
jgi:two-component system phosphate regulon response regulator PhoB